MTYDEFKAIFREIWKDDEFLNFLLIGLKHKVKVNKVFVMKTGLKNILSAYLKQIFSEN